MKINSNITQLLQGTAFVTPIEKHHIYGKEVGFEEQQVTTGLR